MDINTISTTITSTSITKAPIPLPIAINAYMAAFESEVLVLVPWSSVVIILGTMLVKEVVIVEVALMNCVELYLGAIVSDLDPDFMMLVL